MNKAIGGVVLVGGLVLCAAACAPEPEEAAAFPVRSGARAAVAELREGVVSADASFVRDVKVTETTLLVPANKHSALLHRLRPGTIVVGAPSTEPEATSKNPLGFARRVKAVRTVDGVATISTEPVTLKQVFEKLDLRTKLRATEAPAAGALRRQDVNGRAADAPLEGSVSGRSFNLNGVVRTEPDHTVIRANLAMTDVYTKFRPDIDVEISDTREAARFQISYEAGANFCGEIDVDQKAGLWSNGETLDKTLASGRLAAVTVGGVPLTVRWRLEAACGFRATGRVAIAGSFHTKGARSLSVGFGEPFPADPSPDANTTIDVRGEGSATAGLQCELVAKAGVYVFDMLGVYASIGPEATADLRATTAQDGTTNLCAVAALSIGQKVGIEARVLGQTLAAGTAWSKSYELKKLDRCGALEETCAGRANGHYCSDLDPKASIECRDGVMLGHQCGDAGYCQRTGPLRTDFAEMAGDQAKCGPAMPAPSRAAEPIQCAATQGGPPPRAEEREQIGPCNAERSSGYYCSADEPHLVYDCGLGQVHSDCGTDFCRPDIAGSAAKQDYANRATFQHGVEGGASACHPTPYMCPESAAWDPGWYCSSLNEGVAIRCGENVGADGRPRIQSFADVRTCGVGSRCRIDASRPTSERHAQLDASGQPACE